MSNETEQGITVKIVGGLGNQLFGYAAGLSLARQLKCPLFLDTSWFLSQEASSFSLNHFNIEASVINNDKPVFLTWTILQKFYDRSKLILPHKKEQKFEEEYFNFNPKIYSQKIGVQLNGYFQSWKYFKGIERHLEVMLQNPKSTSHWFNEQIVKDEYYTSRIGVHVRLGDYTSRKVSKVIGVLTQDYYREALNFISKKTGIKKILLFSNEIEKIEVPFNKWGYDVEVVTPNKSSTDFESLKLLSNCAGIVMANSSFSWWASWLADREKPITAPSPWFRNISYSTEDLCLSNWHLIQSKFID
jgi:hypothetical protein